MGIVARLRRVWYGFGPGMGRHGRRTPTWVFAVHGLLVFITTVGMTWAFSAGYMGLGVAVSVLWLGAFALMSTDNVRIPRISRSSRKGDTPVILSRGQISPMMRDRLGDEMAEKINRGRMLDRVAFGHDTESDREER